MSRTCPSCGAAVSDAAKFCRACGGRVIAEVDPPRTQGLDTAATCATCGAELITGARFCHMCAAQAPPPARPARIVCPGCGKEIDGTDAFCRYCGTDTADWAPDRRGSGTSAELLERGAEPSRSEPAEPEPSAMIEPPIGMDAPVESASPVRGNGASAESPASSEEMVPTPESTSKSGDTSAPPARPGALATFDEESVVFKIDEPPTAGSTTSGGELPQVVDTPSAEFAPAAPSCTTEPEGTVIAPSANGTQMGGSQELVTDRSAEFVSGDLGSAVGPDAKVSAPTVVETVLGERPHIVADASAGLGSVDLDSAEEAEATITASTEEGGAGGKPPESRCGACQQPVSATARFCRSCGASLGTLEATVVMPRPAALTCGGCGREIEDWAQFCRHCGARRATQTSKPESESTCDVCGAPATGSSSLCANCAQAVGA